MIPRKRIEKKMYTPTGTPEPNSFLCKLIDSDDYIIVQRSSIKRLNENTAEIIMQGRRVEVCVEHQGNFSTQCSRVLNRLC
jgi:hypothetical protein